MSDIKTVLTVDEVLDYLGIDYADDKVNRNITRAISTADKMLQGSIGVNYPVDDPRSKELALIIVSDLYDIRGMTCRDNVSNNVRRLVDDMSLQLRLELGSEPITPPYDPDYPDIDITVDDILDIESGNPISNRAVTEAINAIHEWVGDVDDALSNDISRIDYNVDGLLNDFQALYDNVDGLYEQMQREAHFKGYLSTNAKIQALEATPNDFAYSAESGTKWVYDEVDGWVDTGTPVPDQLTPASDITPLMNGTATPGTSETYARGDHRHPTDTTRASVAELNELKADISTALDRIIEIQNTLIGGGNV